MAWVRPPPPESRSDCERTFRSVGRARRRRVNAARVAERAQFRITWDLTDRLGDQQLELPIDVRPLDEPERDRRQVVTVGDLVEVDVEPALRDLARSSRERGQA